MFKKFTALGVAMSAALLASTSAGAVTVTLQNTSAYWQNEVGGEDITRTSGDPATISWGETDNWWDPQSGYKFDAVNPSVQFVLPPNPTALKELGTFTHMNNPIDAGTSITSVQLRLATTLWVDSTNLGLKNFIFNFSHDETSNTGGGCCSDIVTFGSNNSSSTFNVGGVDYTLHLAGFSIDGGNNILTSFSSQEGGNRNAKLYGYVSTANAVPEPATWAMMIGGMGLVGMSMRRRPTKVSFA